MIYDTRSRVVSRTINGTTTYFVWDGWDLIEERNAAGSEIRHYVHGAQEDEILAMVDTAGTHYHHHDALGSVVALTNTSGTLVEIYKYDTFGKVTVTDVNTSATADSSFFGNRFLYTGREWSAEAGLYDYRNRVYSAALGRFLQKDPIMFEAGDANVYRYVGNDVVSLVDPWGLDVKFKGVIGTKPGTKNKLKQAYENVKKTKKGAELAKELEKPGKTYIIKCEAKNDAYFDPNINVISVDPDFQPEVETTDGKQKADTESVMAHEMGHAATGAKDDGPGRMNNVKQNENPVRKERGQPARTKY